MAVADVFENEARDILKGLNLEESDPLLVGTLYAIISLADVARRFEGNVNALAYRCEELEAENAALKKHCEWLEQNLNLKNTVVDDLKNELRDALERC